LGSVAVRIFGRLMFNQTLMEIGSHACVESVVRTFKDIDVAVFHLINIQFFLLRLYT